MLRICTKLVEVGEEEMKPDKQKAGAVIIRMVHKVWSRKSRFKGGDFAKKNGDTNDGNRASDAGFDGGQGKEERGLPFLPPGHNLGTLPSVPHSPTVEFCDASLFTTGLSLASKAGMPAPYVSALYHFFIRPLCLELVSYTRPHHPQNELRILPTEFWQLPVLTP